MKTRFMRIILFFDLPTTSKHDLSVYTHFRKNLIKDGFVMMQYSVYSKLVLNATAVNTVRSRINRLKPSKGNVQLLVVTEQQFARIEYIVGENDSTTFQSLDRTIII
jgi:CRISPR-associated protein Cas2